MLSKLTKPWSEEANHIKNTVISDDMVSRVKCTEDAVEFYDKFSDRVLYYRIVPHTRQSLLDLIHAGPDVGITDTEKNFIAQKLLELPPEILFDLKHIILINSKQDAKAILFELEMDAGDIVRDLFDMSGDDLTDDNIGIQWIRQSAVILNIKAINETAQELAEKDKSKNFARRLQDVFWTTLFHEIRHNQINALIYKTPWLDETDAQENAVEQWALGAYQILFGRIMPSFII